MSKKIKICENCKYEDVGLWELPCRDCLIETNDLWKPNWVRNDDNS